MRIDVSSRREPTPLVKAVLSRLEELDNKYGGLTDNHLKFLIFLVKETFGTDHYKIIIDFNSNPRCLYINPLKDEKTPFGIIEWVKRSIKLKIMELRGKKLNIFLGLNDWKIIFERKHNVEIANRMEVGS